MNAQGRIRWLTLALTVATGLAPGAARADAPKPNFVHIVIDELGYYELSCMGHPHMRTPNVDRLAAEGTRFTQILAGGPVCAPTRAVLMTGKHLGHASVRTNGGGTPIQAGEATIASVLRAAGYATGGFGKWGCGNRGTTGVPEQHGFDVFFGYYDQVHAHTYYPPYLIRNSEEVPLEGNPSGGREGKTYSQYRIFDEAKAFLRANKDRPFYLYLPFTPPHGMFDIPESDPAWALYKDKDWPGVDNGHEPKAYAAMVAMIDRQVGEVMAMLRESGLDGRTLVLFSGDNGGNPYFKDAQHPRGFHAPNVDPKTGVEFRDGKGSLFEGGLRIPFIARWPGRIAAGRTCDHLGYFPDVMPTIAELAGVECPKGIDGISFVPALLGEEPTGRKQAQHDFLYWESPGNVAVRMGTWKAVRSRQRQDWKLFDLAKDISETTDVAAANPDVVKRMAALAEQAHVPERTGDILDQALYDKDHRSRFGGDAPSSAAGKPGRRKAAAK
jgi:arylsulfatase A-like enzyme